MRILVSKPDALGDQVLAAAFIQALRRQWPDAQIVWHVRAGMEVIATLVEGAAVFTADPTLDPATEARRLRDQPPAPIAVVPYAIHPFAEWEPGLEARFGWWGAFLAATDWDLAVAPVVNRTGLTDFTVTASQARHRVAFTVNGACQPLIEAAFTHLPLKKADFTHEVPSSLHASEFDQLAAVLALVAPAATLQPPVLRFDADAQQRAEALLGDSTAPVLLAPGVGQHAQRAWPLARFFELARELRSRGRAVRWIEGPFDAATFTDLPDAENASRLRFDAARPDVLAAALSRAALLICNDTAYVHLAAALGTPTVAVFGAGQKSRFVPRFGRVRVVQGDPVCRGCQWQCAFDRYVCVQDLPLATVLAASDEQLASPAAGHARHPLSLPFAPPADAAAEVEKVRDWYQEELDRIRWDGWARLQIINDVISRLQARDARLAALTAERDALAARLRDLPSAPVLPRLSVIIPMGRPERADGTLQSLARQTLRPADWEVVVVGVGAASLPARYPNLPIVPVELEHNLLPPHTRACGVEPATGEWFVFVDDDIQLAPDFFEMLLRVLTCAPAGAGPENLPVGAYGVRMPGGRGTYFEHLTDISNFWSQQSPLRAVPHTVWFLYSATIVIRAEAYRRAGGFNIELPNGEDVDLTQRIKAAGYVLGYEPSLVVHHFHGRDSLFRMWRYFWKNGNTARYFFSHHGGACCYSLRTGLVRGWRDLQMNRDFQKTQGVRLGLRTPWILLNYLIFENSLEWHWQEYLYASGRYRELPARTASDRNAVAAFTAFAAGRRFAGVARYTLALLQNLADPVRR